MVRVEIIYNTYGKGIEKNITYIYVALSQLILIQFSLAHSFFHHNHHLDAYELTHMGKIKIERNLLRKNKVENETSSS